MKTTTLICFLAMLPAACYSQSVSELRELLTPTSLELSSDGALLWYRFGKDWWEVRTVPNSQPKRAPAHRPAAAEKPPDVHGTPRVTSPRRSPDGKRVAYIDAERPYGPGLLYCLCDGSESGKPQPV